MAPGSSPAHRREARQIGRFLLVGAANTLVTGAIFYALSFVLPAGVAYTIAFGLGIGFAVGVTPRFVFSVRPRARRRVAYAAWYVIVYLVGLGVVFVLDDIVGADHLLVVAVTVTTTSTLSYLGGRAILAGSSSRGNGD